MSFARLAISTATTEPLPVSDHISLPSREIATALVQACLRDVFSVYPVLTETLIYGYLESVYQHNGQYGSSLAIWNVRLAIAIGLLLRSRHKGDADYETACRHLAVALNHAETVLQPGIATTTQAVLLLLLYSILDPAHFSPWYLLSIAVRVWIDIGLHQEPAHLKRPSHVVQHHRRLFYCIYSLDRYVVGHVVRYLRLIPIGPSHSHMFDCSRSQMMQLMLASLTVQFCLSSGTMIRNRTIERTLMVISFF